MLSIKPVKLIKNYCLFEDEKCIVSIDGMFYTHDITDTQSEYPCTFTNNVNGAFIFRTQQEAFDLTTWILGEEYKIIPLRLVGNNLDVSAKVVK